MLNRLYYLQTDVPAEGLAAADGITIAHLLDGRSGRVTALIRHLYSAAGNYPFCLALKDCEDPVVAIREALLLFFHPSYQMTEKGRPVFVWSPADGAAGVGRGIEALFRGQGIEAEVIFVESGAGKVNQLEAGEHDPAADYYQYCLSRYCAKDVFLLTGGELSWWQRQLERITTGLAEQHASFYRLATERLVTGELAANRGREVARLREDLQAMQRLLELSSRQDEVEYILRFYRNEYEILPLWFKRLGHLIKVIQGKRNFRSLFDKSVKKYKE